MNRLIFSMLIFVSSSSYACSFSGLEHEIRFVSKQAIVSPEERRGLAEWVSQKRAGFPSGGKYSVVAYRNPENGIPQELAESRLAATEATLLGIGIEAGQLEYTVVMDRMIGGEKSLEPFRLVNKSLVIFQPACPNACCAGDEDKPNGKSSEHRH